MPTVQGHSHRVKLLQANVLTESVSTTAFTALYFKGQMLKSLNTHKRLSVMPQEPGDQLFSLTVHILMISQRLPWGSLRPYKKSPMPYRAPIIKA